MFPPAPRAPLPHASHHCAQMNAIYVSPTEVLCVAPVASSGSSEHCGGGEALELSLSTGAVTQNKVAVQRVATPSVLTVEPNEGYWLEAHWVTLRGYGFVPSDELSCKFISVSGGVHCVHSTECVRP